MSSSSLIRWSGLAAILSGVVSVVVAIPPALGGGLGLALEVGYIVSSILMLFGIMGLYAYQNEESGLPGFLGFLLAISGTAVMTGPGEIAGVPNYMIGGALAALGLILLAIGFWKANKLPRWIPALWIIATVVGIGGFAVESLTAILQLIGSLGFGAGFVGAGYKLWSSG